MIERFLADRIELHYGDCLAVLPAIGECLIDACVTDPPYHLISIVKRFGAENAAPAKVGKTGAYARASAGFMGRKWDGGDIASRPDVWREVYRVLKPGAYLLAFGGTRTFHRMACAIEDAGFEIRDTILYLYGSGFPKSHDVSKGLLTASATDAARQWQGWGTALKPACEPIVLARKPLSEPTIAANVLKWGTGALNIDRCRVVTAGQSNGIYGEGLNGAFGKPVEGLGRWPANLILDSSEEVLAGFPESQAGTDNGARGTGGIWQPSSGVPCGPQYGDSDSAARFFYTAKADSDDRLGSKHPTVKPLDLMQYLVRLVTPLNGLVLDPFAGTGTTGEAAWREGMRAVLVEREQQYTDDIRRRMQLALSGPDERAREAIKERTKDKPIDAGPLFGGTP